MINFSISVKKDDVYAIIDKTTGYTGVKGVSDSNPGNYERVSTTTADHKMLDKWWGEACTIFTNKVKQFVASIVESSEAYQIMFAMPSTYDIVLNNSVETSMFNFFVDYILQRWYTITNNDAAEEMANEATALMDDIMSKLFYRKRPTKRVKPTTSTTTQPSEPDSETVVVGDATTAE